MLETFSITTHEAFQRGVPVVAARRRGARRVRPPRAWTGCCSRGRRAAGRLERLIEDPPWRRLSANAPPVPTVAEQAARVESLYARLRERAGSR